MKNKLQVEITTTQSCNMACTYCFEGAELQNKKKQMHIDTILAKLIELKNSDKFKDEFSGININFWGGEPTMAFEVCNKIITHFKDSDTTFFFYTNGYSSFGTNLILQHYIKEIGTNFDRISFQVSYDGLYNDIERVDHKGEATSPKIFNFLDFMKEKYPDVVIRLKSVMLPEHLKTASKNWKHFKDIVERYNNPAFCWAPTLEYTNNYNITQNDLNEIEIELLKIAKLEMEYFKKTNHFLLTWFSSASPAVCSAGTNILNIDLDGNLTVCHGALYSSKKEELTLSNITNEHFIEEYFNNRMLFKNAFLNRQSTLPDECVGCDATVCYQCPTVNFDNSKKEKNSDKFYDIKTDLCDIYKMFGRISQVVNKNL